MKKRNIYSNQSQELLALFENVQNSSKLLCVPIDYAKEAHMVMFCNGHGDVIRKPFAVKNNLKGVEYLMDQVSRSCKHRGINNEHVFFGGEDTGSYADNFISNLRNNNWLVAGVNPKDAKDQRANLQASTDRLDLIGIAKTLLNKRGNCRPAQSGTYLNLRNLTRHRRRLVHLKTAVRNQIHAVVDRLFPGFLDEKKSGINPFSKGSLWLMQDRFSSTQIRRRRMKALIKSLRRHHTSKPERSSKKLKEYASQVLVPPDEYLSTLQLSLSQHVKHYRCLLENIEQLEKEIAIWLAQTTGAFLTSIKGVGITLASGVAGEIGDPLHQKPLHNLVSYAGIIPNVKQTGGPEGETYTGKVKKRSNRILKDYLVQSASHIGLHGPKDLKTDYRRREVNKQHADFGIARRYLRMAMCLMKTSQIYTPVHLRTSKAKPVERAEYYLSIWPYLRDKWRKLDAHKAAFSKDCPLGEWRDVIQKIYRIKLDL